MRRQPKRYTENEIQEVWRRWKNGESIRAIARKLDRFPETVVYVLSKHGGVKLPVRSRSSLALNLSEREEISRGLASGLSLRDIASNLQRSPSTISREVKRNGGSHGYRAELADQAAWDRASRPKHCKIAYGPLKKVVVSKLKSDWSPQQISGWLKHAYPTQEEMWVSHETIYKSLYIQTRGVLKKELLKQLRTKPRLRGSRNSAVSQRGLIPGLVSISERPASIEDRALPGHWEGDLIEGSRNSFVASLVERHTRFVCLVKVQNKTTEEVVKQLVTHAKTIPVHLYQSLTWDRGAELKRHREFTLATDIDVYFCDPKSPWQRGTNENTNRLLRQYLPKGTDLSVHSQKELNQIARKLNERPRKTLNYETPAERFAQCVALTN